MHIAVDLVIIHYTHSHGTHSMMDEYAYGKDVWFTGVINKSANVPVILGINAVQLLGTFLQIKGKLEINKQRD